MEKPDIKEFISFSPLLIGQEEINEVIDSLKSGWITTGPKVIKFQNLFTKYIGTKYSVACYSCTDAMNLVLTAVGITEEDEVITSPFTFASTGHVICYKNAKPVFVDIDKDTFNIDVNKIEERITDKTKAIIPVHYGGHPCDMDKIMEIAKKYNLFVIEDAAHSIGSEYKGKKIGIIGDYTCFSFYATKNLTTAEGGMVTSNNEEIMKKIKILTMYGIDDAREIWHKRYSKEAADIHYDIAELGYKCNMTDILAALGIHQLAKLDRFNKTRQKYSSIYNEYFASQPALRIPVVRNYIKSNWHLYPILLDLGYINISRDKFITELKKLKIGTTVLFMPLHLHSYYSKNFGFEYGDFPVSENVFERIINIPISPSISEKNIRKIAEGILYLIEKFKR